MIFTETEKQLALKYKNTLNLDHKINGNEKYIEGPFLTHQTDSQCDSMQLAEAVGKGAVVPSDGMENSSSRRRTWAAPSTVTCEITL